MRQEGGAGRTIRALLAFLAIVFLLHAADPTPRFLGIHRRRSEAPCQPQHETARRILPRYVLPDGICTEADAQDATPTIAVSPALPPVTSLAPLSRFECASLGDPRASTRNGSGPPLRC